MNEVLSNVFVGSDADVSEFNDTYPDGVVIHAAKEPWHRQHVGYTGRGAPKGHAEYLVGRTDTELFLNLVDSPKPEFIPRTVFDEAAKFYAEHQGTPILIHCNQGKSRGPAVAMYCIKAVNEDFAGMNLEDAVDEMADLHGLEPEFGEGVAGALMEWWDDL